MSAFRRILQVGVNNAELFMNLGLCCFFCQQFDLAISCIERAQNIASDDVVADVWYNTGNVLLVGLSLSSLMQFFMTADCKDIGKLRQLAIQKWPHVAIV